MLNDPEMIIFVVGEAMKRYHLHRKLVQSATMVFNITPSSTADVDPDIRMMLHENEEIFEEFVAWLYTRNLTSQLSDGSVDLIKLIRIYIFALMWHVCALKDAAMQALMATLNTDFDAFFATIEKVFEEADDPYRHRIAQVLDAVSKQLLSVKDLSTEKLLSLYTSSIKWRCNRLKNVIMDTLQDTLLTQS